MNERDLRDKFPGYSNLDDHTKRRMKSLIEDIEDSEPGKIKKIAEGSLATIGTIAAMAYIINERDNLYDLINKLLKEVVRQEVRRAELFRKVLAQGVMIDSQNVRIDVIERKFNV